MAFISAMAEDERLRIIKRTHEGRAIARENGVKMGRKFRLNDVQRTEARQRLVNGEAASQLDDRRSGDSRPARRAQALQR